MDPLTAGVLAEVLNIGLDTVGITDDAQKVDLAPVLEAMEVLRAQGAEILFAVSNPTQTAGDEMSRRAVTAFQHGWYEDAHRDALESVRIFPYNTEPHLVGALAAMALGDGSSALSLFRSATKYGSNNEPVLGAIAGLYGARLALAVGGRNLALDLVAEADRLTDGRCPAVVAAMAYLKSGDPEWIDRLTGLWWDDNTDFLRAQEQRRQRGEPVRIPSPTSEYDAAGPPFIHALTQIETLARNSSAARHELEAQLEKFKTARKTNLHSAAMSNALPLVGIRPPMIDWSIGNILTVVRSAKGLPEWPGTVAWKWPSIADLPDLALTFTFAQAAADFLTARLGDLQKIPDDKTKKDAVRSVAAAATPYLPRWFESIQKTKNEISFSHYDAAVRADGRYDAVRKEPTGKPVQHLHGIPQGALPTLAH